MSWPASGPSCLVVDPHTQKVLGVEDADGQPLGAATPLDAVANVQSAAA